MVHKGRFMCHLSESLVPNLGKTLQFPQSNSTPEVTNSRYGDQTPKTQIGKIVTIIYALIGFPLMVICSRNNGIVMANCFRFIYWKCYKCCCGISTSQRHISESFELLIASFYLFEFLKLTLSALLSLFEIKI